jgi:hypothetical protein
MSDGPECFAENYQNCSNCDDMYFYNRPYCFKCFKAFSNASKKELSIFATSPDVQLRNLAKAIYEKKKS